MLKASRGSDFWGKIVIVPSRRQPIVTTQDKSPLFAVIVSAQHEAPFALATPSGSERSLDLCFQGWAEDQHLEGGPGPSGSGTLGWGPEHASGNLRAVTPPPREPDCGTEIRPGEREQSRPLTLEGTGPWGPAWLGWAQLLLPWGSGLSASGQSSLLPASLGEQP